MSALKRLTLAQAKQILDTTDEELQKAWDAIQATKNPRTRVAWMDYHDFLCDQLLAAHRVCQAVVARAKA